MFCFNFFLKSVENAFSAKEVDGEIVNIRDLKVQFLKTSNRMINLSKYI